MRLNWDEVLGKSRPVREETPGLPVDDEGGAEEPFLDKANTWLDGILELVQKIDQVVGFFVDLHDAQETQKQVKLIEGGPSPGEGPESKEGAGPNPGLKMDKDRIAKILKAFVEGEGDLRLSELAKKIDERSPADLMKWAKYLK